MYVLFRRSLSIHTQRRISNRGVPHPPSCNANRYIADKQFSHVERERGARHRPTCVYVYNNIYIFADRQTQRHTHWMIDQISFQLSLIWTTFPFISTHTIHFVGLLERMVRNVGCIRVRARMHEHGRAYRVAEAGRGRAWHWGCPGYLKYLLQRQDPQNIRAVHDT